jgi:uncharacterized phage protein (TIGR02216 family)
MTRFGHAATQLFGTTSQLLGWRPDEFWNSTPAELALALGVVEPSGPDAKTIEALRQRFPDTAATES